jgi:hypothetical protein
LACLGKQSIHSMTQFVKPTECIQDVGLQGLHALKTLWTSLCNVLRRGVARGTAVCMKRFELSKTRVESSGVQPTTASKQRANEAAAQGRKIANRWVLRRQKRGRRQHCKSVCALQECSGNITYCDKDYSDVRVPCAALQRRQLLRQCE